MKYLTLELGKETFGLPVDLVQEVLEYTRVTRVPRCPEYLLGILNLRGTIVAVMDLRRRLGIEELPVSVTTRFVVVTLDIDGKETAVAMMADAVRDVVDIEDDEIDPAPTVTGGDENLRGVAKLPDRMVMLLKAETLLNEALLAESFS